VDDGFLTKWEALNLTELPTYWGERGGGPCGQLPVGADGGWEGGREGNGIQSHSREKEFR
jgi:hypothetical protein